MPLRKQKGSLRTKKQNRKRTKRLSEVSGNHRPKVAEEKLIIDLKREKSFRWQIQSILRELKHIPDGTAPVKVKPMLASIADEAFNNEDWQFEIKWDGYRAIASTAEGDVKLLSRNKLSFNAKYPSLVKELQAWPVNAVIDGEVVILSENGKADFSSLQNFDPKDGHNLFYYVFDILWLEGKDLQSEPLTKRREILKKILPDAGHIRYSESIDHYGVDFFLAAKANGLEGIIAKKNSSSYEQGLRTKQWLKIKAEQRHEALICGYTLKKGTSRVFSSLVLGIPENKGVKFIGLVGTGFNAKMQAIILQKLKPLQTTQNPFKEKLPIKDSVQWVKPAVVCEVKYTELTADGVMRHPSFQGLREDKNLEDYNAEVSLPVGNHNETVNKIDKLLQENKETAVAAIDEQELPLTNLKKLFWIKERLTKGDLINYYADAAPFMMPYMQNRPQSLNRFPNGIAGKNFYQKDMTGKVPSWLTTFDRFSESTGENKKFLVCTDTASLLYMANLGCIEMNPWHSRVDNPLHPDWCVIDLDPGDISFEKVIQTAQVVHNILESLGIPSFPKTSGSTGIHIYIPLGAKYNYEQSKQLAELIANLAHQELPSTTSLLRNPKKRTDKIYLDYLQNRPIQTICAPYSVRPKPGATVSAPLHWSEVKKGLKITQFTMKNMMKRIKQEGDLFEGVLREGIDLNAVLSQLAQMVSVDKLV